LDVSASTQVISRLGERLGLTLHQTAFGIVEIANATMERALRTVSIGSGHDPRLFTLVAFGGAGPLHACALATQLGMSRILIPRHPGVFSAVGLTQAGIVFDRGRSVLASLDDLRRNPDSLERKRKELQSEVVAYFDGRESGNRREPELVWSADLRYRGQSHELNVTISWNSDTHVLDSATEAFHRAHRKRFGYDLKDVRVEMVTLRLRGTSEQTFSSITQAVAEKSALENAAARTTAWFSRDSPDNIPLTTRDSLLPGSSLEGPAIVVQPDTTILIERDWRFETDALGYLHGSRIHVDGEQADA
jgi:N-methylhydantoinase A